ncbi:2-hydroxyacid dehydrogenase [Pseudaestuariivita atlantica]|uniref:2-hydroxyacid dehydrogenase n=1 Tax=Pseudaestuariivita atlantica TaxID=1317121 RepID=A0A0L1JKD0_9RHOB|nr:2-hydroxyacid dehydrogenase [Pseudaestuariivita atlantica]KNG92177.1 2-hydroxyacid dehydrogenase [Pseudaestuariivita atlantica]
MTRPTVLQIGPYPPEDQAALDAAYDMIRLYEAEDPDALLAEVGPRVRAIASRGALKVPGTLIRACPELELIAVYGVGYDGVDMETARAQGVTVTNTPDVLTEDVADWGVAMILGLWRGLPGAAAWVRDGHWAAKGPYPLGRRVHGARVGILGLGRIGRALARRLAAFGMQIAYADPFVADADLLRCETISELAKRSDILCVTLAASPATRHVVDRPVLDALGPDGMLLNISRASNVDEEAMIAALQAGTLGWAALDVFDGEPRIDPRFLDLDRVLLTPHHASATQETRADMGALMRANLAAHFADDPLPSPVD